MDDDDDDDDVDDVDVDVDVIQILVDVDCYACLYHECFRFGFGFAIEGGWIQVAVLFTPARLGSIWDGFPIGLFLVYPCLKCD